jgi:hypothetical protein
LENVIIKFVADTSGLKPAIDQLQLLGKISEADAASFAKINDEQKEFIQNLNKSTTEFGKLNSEVEGLMAEIQAGVMEGFADHLAEVTAETKKSATGFKSIKAELKELKAQIASGNLGEKELRAATKRAGELADAIADANQQVKAFEGNRFERILSRAADGARALSAGMAAAAGAQALFGSENEDFNKTLVKVQGSMALLQGTQELTMLLQKESALMIGLMELKTYALDGAQKVAAVSARAMGTSIAGATAMATAGVSLLVVGLVSLVSYLNDSDDEIDAFNKKIREIGRDEGSIANTRARIELMRKGLSDESKLRLDALASRNKVQMQFEKEFRKDLKTLDNAFNKLSIEDRILTNSKYQAERKKLQDKVNKEFALAEKAYNQDLAAIDAEIAAKKAANQKKVTENTKKETDERLAIIRDEIFGWQLMIEATTNVDEKIKYHQKITQLMQDQLRLNKSMGGNELIYEIDKLNDLQRVYEESFNKRNEADLESYTETQEAKLEVTLDWWEKYFEVEDKYNAELAKKRKEDAQMWTQFAIDQARVVSDTVFTINQNRRNAETEQLLTSLNEQREAELSNKDLTDAQRAQIEKRYRQQEAKIKQQAWEADKRAAIAQAIINGALAVSKTLAVYGWTPAAAPGIIAATVATAAQIAIIQSTPIPQFADGTEFLVGKGTGRSDSNLAYLSHGERVVPAGINSDYFPALSAIQNRDVEPTFANNILTALANGTFDLAAQFQGKQQSTDQGFDYDKLGKVLARNKSSVNIQMDEAGYTKYLIKENSKVEFRNTKLRLKN